MARVLAIVGLVFIIHDLFVMCWRQAPLPNHNPTRCCAFSGQQPTAV